MRCPMMITAFIETPCHDCGTILLYTNLRTWQVARNPLDAFVSFYKFLPDYDGLEPGDITMEQFKDAIFAGAAQAGQIWHHFVSWSAAVALCLAALLVASVCSSNGCPHIPIPSIHLSVSGRQRLVLSLRWTVRNEKNVLWVCFEDLKADLSGQVKRVADFLGIACDEKLLATVVEKSSFEVGVIQRIHLDRCLLSN